MKSIPATATPAATLRLRAIARIAERAGPNAPAADPFIGLRALYDLASTPATADRALAMLHELQVHQIEIDIQDEELRRSRADLESALARQLRVFEQLPLACLVTEADLSVSAANLACSRLLGLRGDALAGRRLDSLLAAESATRLRALVTELGPSPAVASALLALASTAGGPAQVVLRVGRDADGQHLLVALHEA
jgi:PAS domain-containing protein